MFKLKSQYFPQSIGNARGQTTWAGSRQDFAFAILISPWQVQVFHQEAEHNLEQEDVDMEDLDILDPIGQFARTKLLLDAQARNGPSSRRHRREELRNALVR
jgi:hypothetical protein